MNYVGEHPLNLLSTLAVVSSASTSTGAAICRALLNSNALVLGVDSDEPHPSTQSSRASHFQFLKYAPEDSEKVCFKGSVVRDAEKKFGREGIDVLVVVKEEGSDMGLNGMRDVVDFMKGQEEGGLVITVYAGKDQKEEAKIVSLPSIPHFGGMREIINVARSKKRKLRTKNQRRKGSCAILLFIEVWHFRFHLGK